MKLNAFSNVLFDTKSFFKKFILNNTKAHIYIQISVITHFEGGIKIKESVTLLIQSESFLFFCFCGLFDFESYSDTG